MLDQLPLQLIHQLQPIGPVSQLEVLLLIVQMLVVPTQVVLVAITITKLHGEDTIQRRQYFILCLPISVQLQLTFQCRLIYNGLILLIKIRK